MIKDPKIFIEHILECIELIEEYIKGKVNPVRDFTISNGVKKYLSV